VKSIEKLLNYSIALVVIAIAVSFFLLKQQKENPKVTKNKMSEQEVDKVVNKYLQQALDENKVNAWKTQKALIEARLKIEKDMEAMKRKQEEEMQKIPAERQIWSESEMAKVANQSQNVPKVQDQPKRKLLQTEDFDLQSMTPEEKKEYARQYIENARRGGYLIELDDNLEVIKSTPIRKPTQQDDSIDNLNGG
jgi:hypothetical protein